MFFNRLIFIFVTTVNGCCLLCLGLLKILIKVMSTGMKMVTHMTLILRNLILLLDLSTQTLYKNTVSRILSFFKKHYLSLFFQNRLLLKLPFF